MIYAGFVVASGAGSRALGERAPHELARERARQRVDDLDARRQLVARELAARVAQQLDRIGVRTGARHDERDDGFAGARMRSRR